MVSDHTVPQWNGKTVLITGINGYIACTLGLLLLQRGYAVRGTIRDASKAQRLVNGAYAVYGDRFELVVIPDMSSEGSLDQAVAGVNIIFHLASPVAFHLRFSEVVGPAVKFTENVLNAALNQAGPQLEAVVVTSSGAAMIRPAPPAGYVFTENDRNTFADSVMQTGIDHLPEEAVGYAVYSASKLASDDAMWRFFQDKKPPFSMTSIHPAVVMGPAPTFPESPDDLAEGLKPLYKVWAGTSKEMPPPIGTSSYVDVRDVAEMHLWAALNPQKANGQRYIAAAGYGPAQAFADILREHYPDDKRIVEGTSGKGYTTGTDWCERPTQVWYPPERPQLCGRKIVEHMGIGYRSLAESIVDIVEEWKNIYHRE